MQYGSIRSYASSTFFRLILATCLVFAVNGHVAARSALAATGIAEDETVLIDVVQIEGLVHTTQDTLFRLLPRSLPAEFTKAEIEEFERRVRNLSLFDRVQVTRAGQNMTVEVQEKITLAPILNFTSGTSVKDLNATMGLVEYNLFGTGTQLGGQFSYSQRGPNVDLWLSQHAFEPGRWAKEIKGSYNVNGIRFADSASTWNRNRIGSELELKGPYRYGSPLRYEGSRCSTGSEPNGCLDTGRQGGRGMTGETGEGRQPGERTVVPGARQGERGGRQGMWARGNRPGPCRVVPRLCRRSVRPFRPESAR